MERYITEEQIRQAEEFTRVYQSFGEGKGMDPAVIRMRQTN